MYKGCGTLTAKRVMANSSIKNQVMLNQDRLYNADEIWKSHVSKNLTQRVLASSRRTAYEEGSHSQLLAAGAHVTLAGMRKRPHLNGTVGEILSDGPDDEGFVTVRVFGSLEGDGARRFKVHPCRLHPRRSSSSPGLVDHSLNFSLPRGSMGRTLLDNGTFGHAESVFTDGTGGMRLSSAASRSRDRAATPMSMISRSIGEDASCFSRSAQLAPHGPP